MSRYSLLYIVSLFMLLMAAELFTACRQEKAGPRVWAQMYVKGEADTAYYRQGYKECFAEGKHYSILAVDSLSFPPGVKSFNRMHHHGVAIESGPMAYRIYFDKRQTVDVYAKRRPKLELAESLWYPNDSLLACGYGDDVLRVGNSIGVGSVRPFRQDSSGDKGQASALLAWEPMERRTQRIVRLSRDTAVVQAEVYDWQPPTEAGEDKAKEGDSTVSVITRYTMTAASREMVCEVYATAPSSCLCTGVQHVGGDSTRADITEHAVLLTSWGTDWPVNDTVKYGKETVGLAVSVGEAYAGRPFDDGKQLLVPLVLHRTDRPSGAHVNDVPATFGWYARFRLMVVAQKEEAPPARTQEEFLRLAERWSRQTP
ncbi:MAG: DUF4861 family protein [Paludibacteraceae bacterium]|nr:DUF4861 family protein [Paludibacteraceae bacterium]